MKAVPFKGKVVKTMVKGLIIMGSVFLFVAVYTLLSAQLASATPDDLALARTKYPDITGTRIDSCSLCHTGSIPDLNPYGSAYLANGRNLAAFDAIQNADNDGDGFTNIQEITALTFPGDPADHPAPPTNFAVYIPLLLRD